MAKGIKAAPKKRKKRRLSEHARLVEERARSIPPGVVHELFDTSSLPVPPPAPVRHPQPGRLVSKPPPPPPRPSRLPGEEEVAELTELTELEELEEVDATEESQTDGYGSHTIPPQGSAEGGAARPSAQRFRVLPALGFAAVIGVLALFTGRELGRSRDASPPAQPKTASAPVAERPTSTSPPAPVAEDLPRLPPGAVASASAEPSPEVAEAPKRSSGGAEPITSIARVTPDPVTASAALAAPAMPRAATARTPAEPDPGALPAFDAAVADAAIQAAFQRARGCRSATDPKGLATVTLTYAPSGRVTNALVSGIFAGTSTGGCIAAALRSARIAPFTGALVTVKRSATLQ